MPNFCINQEIIQVYGSILLLHLVSASIKCIRFDLNPISTVGIDFAPKVYYCIRVF